ncbi:MAG: hypothetical protein KGL31_07525 [candidate division NC10 bacterium]|nr:hypothetical protein [candidate division NC10 bacterium]MDE2321752.1 hypothetical protein [candidate division NC10 bacterium]
MVDVIRLSTRKRRPKPGDLAALRRRLWYALTQIETLIEDKDPSIKLKAAHALATMAGAYLKASELADFEGRLQALESKQRIA